jgi:hypothetical protein
MQRHAGELGVDAAEDSPYWAARQEIRAGLAVRAATPACSDLLAVDEQGVLALLRLSRHAVGHLHSADQSS